MVKKNRWQKKKKGGKKKKKKNRWQKKNKQVAKKKKQVAKKTQVAKKNTGGKEKKTQGYVLESCGQRAAFPPQKRTTILTTLFNETHGCTRRINVGVLHVDLIGDVDDGNGSLNFVI